jgi:hypothetical protein
MRWRATGLPWVDQRACRYLKLRFLRKEGENMLLRLCMIDHIEDLDVGLCKGEG